MTVLRSLVLGIVLVCLIDMSLGQGASQCCCSAGYLAIAPQSVTMECLYQHDYLAQQWTEQYTGFASRIDACYNIAGNTNPSGGAFEPGCGTCGGACFTPGYPGWTDQYGLTSTSNQYLPGCGNTITINRYWSYTCGAGDDVDVLQQIVIEDTVPPELVVPPSGRSQECISTDGIAGPDYANFDFDNYFGSARATDLCTNPTLSETISTLSDNSCIFNIRRTFTASDSCNPNVVLNQDVSFVDTTPPVMQSLVGNVITVACQNVPTPISTRPTATDSCDNIGTGVPANTDVIYPGKCTGDYSIERTWTVSDTCGNTGYYVQTIIVEDVNPPTVDGGAPLNHYAESNCAAPTPPTYLIDDACGSAYLSFEETTTGINELENHYDVIRTYRATDDCGNYVTWRDVTNVNLNSVIDISGAPKEIASVTRGVNTVINYNIAPGSFFCETMLFFFDVGAAQVVSITGLDDCTVSTGGAVVCTHAPILTPLGTALPIVLTINVPVTYLPGTLEVRLTSATSNPLTNTSTNLPSRTILLLQ